MTPPGPDVPTIATVLLPAERARVEAAGSGSFAVLHRETVPEAIRTVRERAVDAVLLSVHRCDAADADAVRSLVRSFPGLPAVALVTRYDEATPASILRLGASGVREVVDVTAPTGWGRLRRLLSEPATRPAARILGPVLEHLPGIPADGRVFVEAMVRLAPHTPTVRGLTRVFRVRPSTLMSRFNRAGLPSPKQYLAAIRLLYAAQSLENEGLSIADAAYRLEYSSPQSFGRHVRSLLGITCTEFRRRFPFPVALDRFLRLMLDPYVAQWQAFRPLGAGAVRAAPVPDPAPTSTRDR